MSFNHNIVGLEGGVDCVTECVPLGDCKDWFLLECGLVSSIYFHAVAFGCWEAVSASSAQYDDACR